MYERDCSTEVATVWIHFFNAGLEELDRDGEDLLDLQSYLDHPVQDFELLPRSVSAAFLFDLVLTKYMQYICIIVLRITYAYTVHTQYIRMTRDYIHIQYCIYIYTV